MNWKPSIRFVIPSGDTTSEVDVVSLAPHGNGYRVSNLAYLQYIRSGMLRVMSPTGLVGDNSITKTYLANVSNYTKRLAASVEVVLGDRVPDAILEVPSSRDLDTPYTQAVRERFPQALDLSSHFSRLGNVKSGEGASATEVLADTVAVNVPRLDSISTIVIVDDVLQAGKAAGAAIIRLREAGLTDAARIVLAVPLVAYAPSSAC